MIIYICTLLLCTMLAMVGYQDTHVTRSSSALRTKSLNKRYLCLYIPTVLFMLLAVGLRDGSIGRDTWNYMNSFQVMSQYDFSYLSQQAWYSEPGYLLTTLIFGKLGLSWYCYAVFMAALFLVPAFYLIYKKTDNMFFALLLFIMAGYWTYPMSTMRQAAAMGIVILAFLDEKKTLRCIWLILLASTFHVSALIAFLYFAALKLPLKKKNAITWIIAGAIVVIMAVFPLKSILFKILAFFGRENYVAVDTGGQLLELFFVLTILIALFYVPDYGDLDYVASIKALYVAAVLLPVVRIHPALLRIYSYFAVYQVVLVPKLLSKIRDRVVKFIAYMCYISVYLFLFFTQFMVESLKVVPYRFFWV